MLRAANLLRPTPITPILMPDGYILYFTKSLCHHLAEAFLFFRTLPDIETNLMEAISNNAVNPDNPKSTGLIVFWVSQIYAFEEEQLWMNNHLQAELEK